MNTTRCYACWSSAILLGIFVLNSGCQPSFASRVPQTGENQKAVDSARRSEANTQGVALRVETRIAGPLAMGTPIVLSDAMRAIAGIPRTDLVALSEEKFDGKVASVGSNKFVAADDSGTEHIFMVADDTMFMLDGRVVKFADLAVGQRVSVTAEADGEVYIASAVVATSE